MARGFSYAENARIWKLYWMSFGRSRYSDKPDLQFVRARFYQEFGNDAPTKINIIATVKKFRRTHSVKHKKGAGRPKSVVTEDNCAKVMAEIAQDPTKSLRMHSRESAIKLGNLMNIKKVVKLKSFKIHILHAMTPADLEARMAFCERITPCVELLGVDFVKNIWFSDECHVHLSGHFNRQNYRNLGLEKPDLYKQVPLHSEKVTVWCAVSAYGIGPYFYEEDARPVTVNGERYQSQILERLQGDLRLFCLEKGLDFNCQWFQQDGAPPRVTNSNRQWLEEHFPNRHISRLTRIDHFPGHHAV
jgi:hypothetical protein